MMNDVREIRTPASAEAGTAGKIVVAIAVALGFGAIGTYAFETGTTNSQPKQAVAADSVSSPAPQLSALPSMPPPQPTADLPPSPAKNAPAQTSPQAAAPQVKLARVQAPAPSVPHTKAAEAPKDVSTQTSPEATAPADNIPAQAAPQNTNTSSPASTPEESAPAQDAPAQ